MAESNYRNTAEQNELAQDDPFAELTRIMGHDPRSVTPDLQAMADETNDLALELENELMGEAAIEADDQSPTHAGAEVISWPRGAAAMEEPQQPAADTSFEDMLDAVFSDEAESFEEFEEAAGEEEVLEEDPFAIGDDDLTAPDAVFTPEPARSYEPLEREYGQEADSYAPEADDYDEIVAADEAAAGEPFDYARAVSQKPDFLSFDKKAESQVQASSQAQELHDEFDGRADDAHPAWDRPAGSPHDEASDPETGFREEWSSEFEPADRAASDANAFPPEVETVDVPEGTVTLADNLDIPDVPYREEVRPAGELDEIEEILAGAFGETTDGAAQSDDVWAETSPAAEVQEDEEDDYFAESMLAGAAGGSAAFAGAQAADAHANDGYEEAWDTAEDDLAPAPGVQPPPATGGPRFGPRSLAAAAAVGGIAILGGVAYFALSFGGDGTGEPALVLADADPVKVKPENPGGIQIPNQDNQVYKRVSGEQANAAPEQGRLISTTEEPIAIAPQLEAISRAEDTEPTETGKIEERLAGSTAQETDNGEDGIALTPRRVRSFVVRADGTMVPNELPEPAPQAQAAADAPQPAGTVSDLAGLTANAPLATDATAVTTPETEQAAETAAVVIPRTGPIPPSRPGNIAAAPQQPVPARQAPPAAQAENTASTQVAAASAAPPAQAAPASEWSVQIASQPTVESAQQSYQNLAQRFGSMLQGKGVNIVKADIEGKGTYYRVRIPSASKDSAIELCSRLKSAGASCFVSK